MCIRDGLHQGAGDHRGGGGEGGRDGVEGEFRVADGDLRVEDDVAVVLQEGARGVPGRGLRGVGHRGHADDLHAEGAGAPGHFHGQGVAAGQGDDHERVAGADGRGVQDGARESVDAFQGGAEGGRGDVDADDPGNGEQVHQGEAAGPVDDVLGGQRGVSGAEGEQAATGRHGVGEQGAGRGDRLGFLLPDPLQQADGGVEEQVGRRAVAHAVPLRSVCVADHPAVWTNAVSIRPWVRRRAAERAAPPGHRAVHLRDGARLPRRLHSGPRMSVGSGRIGDRASARAGLPAEVIEGHVCPD